jgi:hypothetical protein
MLARPVQVDAPHDLRKAIINSRVAGLAVNEGDKPGGFKPVDAGLSRQHPDGERSLSLEIPTSFSAVSLECRVIVHS